MVSLLNDISLHWANLFLAMIVQSSVFVSLILFFLHMMRHKEAWFLKSVTVVGLVKLVVPPFLISDRVNEAIISGMGWLPIITVFPNAKVDPVEQLSLSGFVFLSWLGICLILLIAVSIRHLAFRYGFRDIIPIDNPLSHPDERDLKIMFLQSKKVHSPFVIGLFRHKIILPANWSQWNSQTQRAIITHEIGHIRQGDRWLNLLKIFVLSIHFFNPLAWILTRKLTCFSEILCDEVSLKSNGFGRKAYARVLLTIAEETGGRLTGVSALNFSRTHRLLKTRITYQLSQKEETMMKNSTWANRITILGLSLMVILFSWQCSNDNNAAPSETKQQISSVVTQSDAMDFSSVDVKPELVKKERPEYPEDARRGGIEGTVIVAVTIDVDGSVTEASILKSVPLLDQAALDAARMAQFTPAEHDGKKVKVTMKIPYQFKLK
ncbi:MAG: TonB family protein [Calditrichaceae bacterium]